MAIIYENLDPSPSSNNRYLGLSLDVSKAGPGNAAQRWLAGLLLEDFNFSTDTGKWVSGRTVTGRTLDFTNTLAWSPRGTFIRFTNSLYFYSDDVRKPNPETPDFILHRAPAFPNDCLNNHGGVGKITNPRNPSWRGIALEWRRHNAAACEDREAE